MRPVLHSSSQHLAPPHPRRTERHSNVSRVKPEACRGDEDTVSKNWVRQEEVDNNHRWRLSITVPDNDEIRMPRELLERVLWEAGYIPEEVMPNATP